MPDNCPKCNSDNISIIEPGETSGNRAEFLVECKDCGIQWVEIYTLTGIEIQ